MRERIILTIVFLILAFSVYNAVQDKAEIHEHHAFFNKMTKFANVGGRFTSQDGQELCDEINKIKFNYNDLDLMDCDKFDK